MSEDDSASTSADPAGSPDYRQLAFVGFVAFALLAAAAVAPAATDSGSDSPGDGSSIEPSDDGGDGPDISFDLDDLLDWFDWGDRDGGGTPPEERPCTLFLDRDPTPGSEVTATVRYEGSPVEGATVWFNDRRVGHTNELGRVTGEVPYDETLRIRVDLPGRPDCEFVDSTASAPAVA